MSLTERLKNLFSPKKESPTRNETTLKEILESPNDLAELEKQFDYNFSDRNLLVGALCHRSIQNATSVSEFNSNERLEFLGDSILGMTISEYLYKQYPNQREGRLTKIKGLLVSEAVLFKVAQEINLGKFLIMSKDEHKSGGRKRKAILADAYEAVLGAIYLDGGLAPVRNAVEKHLLENHKDIISGEEFANYKGRLLEHMQARGMGVPRYEVVEENGPEHKKTFRVAAKVKGKQMGFGVGKTKKQAEQKAAKIALGKLISSK
jgi:ribonuclease-3